MPNQRAAEAAAAKSVHKRLGAPEDILQAITAHGPEMRLRLPNSRSASATRVPRHSGVMVRQKSWCEPPEGTI